MKNILCALVVVVGIFASLNSSAGFHGSISFTEREQAEHLFGLSTIMETAAACLQSTLERHRDFYERYGISAYYGDQSAFAKLSTSQQRAQLARLGLSPDLLDEMEATSCVGLSISCLSKGFEAAGQTAFWRRIMEYTDLNDVDGTAMQNALRELGWKVLYWNPNAANNEAWDADEHRRYPKNPLGIWGDHAYNWHTVKTQRIYYYNQIDDAKTLVNFGTKVPAKFAKVPFFVGTAHQGYHVFPGTYGRVVEGHSTRSITDSHTIEESAFNPLRDGGGPRGNYRTGMIAIPPGYLALDE